MLSRIVLFVFCFFINFCIAQESNESLDELVAIGLKTNLKVISSGLQAQMFSQEGDVNSALSDPKFMIEGRQIPMDLSEFGQTQQVMFMVEQMFPFPGKLDAKRKKGEYIAVIQKELEKTVRLDITAAISRLYFELAYFDWAIHINQQHLELISVIEHVAEAKYIVGKTLRQDVIRIQIEDNKFKSQTVLLMENRANIVVIINRLLNRSLETKIDKIFMPNNFYNFNKNDLLNSLADFNPFVKIAEIKLQSSDNEIRLAKLGYKPDVALVGGYMLMNNMDDMYMGRVSLTLPFVPWANKDTKAGIEKAKLLNKKESVLSKDLLKNLQSQFHQILNSLNALEERILFYENNIVPSSQQTVDLSLKSYQTNTMDFLTLLSYSRELLNNKLEENMLRKQYYQKKTELEKLVGIRL